MNIEIQFMKQTLSFMETGTTYNKTVAFLLINFKLL